MASNDKDIRVQGQEKNRYIDEPQRDRIQMYYEYCEDHFRKGHDYNLVIEAFSRVSSFEKTEDGLTISVLGSVAKGAQIDSDGELRPMLVKQDESFQAWVKVELIGEGTFRILAGKGSQPQTHCTVMQEGVDIPKPGVFTVSDDDDCIRLTTECCALVIRKDPFQISLQDKSGKMVYRQENDDAVLDFQYETFPFGYVFNPETNERIISIPGRLSKDEYIFGFGEQYSPTCKNQQEVDVFITDPLSVGSARTYLSVPFYMSTRGYGLYVNTHFRSKFFVGNRSNRAIGCHVYDEPIIDHYLFFGREPSEILKRYASVTGFSPMVPKWSFGLWMSRCSYKTQWEVEEIAAQLRQHDIPCDVMNIDTDWFEQPWACDWHFGKSNFPDAPGMLKRLKDIGIHISLWQKPYITAEYLPDMLKEMDEKGWIPRNKYGEIARFNPVFDISHPDAVKWYKAQLKNLFEQGVSAIKTDMGEGVPVEADYHKYSGREMRNIYAYLYNRAAYEQTLESTGEGLLWARSGYAGSQKYPVHWAGDPFCTFDGLRFTIRSGLSMGLSGFVFWSHDIGGFIGTPSAELYVRWAQAGLFISHSRCHGAGSAREPWAFGAEAERIFRIYDKLRYKLLPYIYSQAWACCQNQYPMMAHLMLSWPHDRLALQTDDEWMFGKTLLVAPVLNEGTEREIYLPDDLFYNFHNNEPVRGGKYLTVEAPLDILPLYARSGEALLFGEEKACVTSEKEEELTVRIYHKDEGEANYPYYDGKEHWFRAVFHEKSIDLELPDLDIPVAVEIVSVYGVKRYEGVSGRVSLEV